MTEEETQLSNESKSSQNIKIGDQIMTPSSRNAIRKNHLLLKTAVKIDRQEQRLHSGEQASNLSYKRLFKEFLFEDITTPQDKNDLTTEQSEILTNQQNMVLDDNSQGNLNGNYDMSGDDKILKLHFSQLDKNNGEFEKMQESDIHNSNIQSQFKDLMIRYKSKVNPKDYLRKLDALQWAKNHNKQNQNSFNKYKAYTSVRRTAMIKNQSSSQSPKKYVSSEYINKIFQLAPLMDYKQYQKSQQKGQNNNSSMLIFAKRKSSIQYMISNTGSPSQRIQLNLINGGFSEKCIEENENERYLKSQSFLGIQHQKSRGKESFGKNNQLLSPSFGASSFTVFKNDMSPLGSQDIQKDKRTRNISIDYTRSQSQNKNNTYNNSSSSSNIQPASDSQGTISTSRKNTYSRKGGGIGLRNSPMEVIKGLENIISELSKDN